MQSTTRFTGRSKQYVKFRPSYPQQVLSYLQQHVGWTKEKLIADVGAGTGIFTKLLLEQGSRVVAIEPNDEMRQALIEYLKPYLVDKEANKQLQVINGSAEATGVADNTLDGIVCAQSFHWFDAGLARAEFMRVLKPQGKVVLLWNQRDVEASAFVRDYEELFMRYGDQYDKVKHKQVSVQTLAPFYGGKQPKLESFYYEQALDYEGLLGRIQSSSFSLTEQDARYDAFIEDCKALFARHEQAGEVKMIYRTDLYWGTLSE